MALQQPRKPVLVWDFDGTLADTWYDIALTLNAALRAEGFAEAKPEQVRAWIGRGVKRLAARAIGETACDEARLEAVVQRFLALYGEMCSRHSRPYPGVRSCLQALSAHPMAIASNKPSRFVAPMVTQMGLGDFFALVYGGDSLAESKPHPLVLSTIAEHFAVPKESLWMIGDSAPDIESARAVGARVIACEWGMRSRQELLAAAPDFLVKEPREIIALVTAGG